MRCGYLRMVEKWRGGDTPIGGWLYGDPGKVGIIFILELSAGFVYHWTTLRFVSPAGSLAVLVA